MQQNLLPCLRLLLFLLLVCFVFAKRRNNLERQHSKHIKASAADDSESWGIDGAAEPEYWRSSGKPADYLLPPTQSVEAANTKIRGKDIRPQVRLLMLGYASLVRQCMRVYM